MSRTYRTYHRKMSLRKQRNLPHKREQALLKDLVDDLDINLGNRAILKAPPEPWDDKPISALSECKRLRS